MRRELGCLSGLGGWAWGCHSTGRTPASKKRKKPAQGGLWGHSKPAYLGAEAAALAFLALVLFFLLLFFLVAFAGVDAAAAGVAATAGAAATAGVAATAGAAGLAAAGAEAVFMAPPCEAANAPVANKHATKVARTLFIFNSLSKRVDNAPL